MQQNSKHLTKIKTNKSNTLVLLLSMLQIVVLLHIFVEVMIRIIFQDSHNNRKLKRTAFI